MGRMGVRGKDVEDEAGTVEHTAFQGLLHVTGLRGAQLIVDDGNFDVFGLDVLMDLLQFSRAKVAHTGGVVHGLHKTRYGHTASRLQQEGQFFEVLFGAFPALLFGSNGDEDGTLRYFFVCDKVAHRNGKLKTENGKLIRTETNNLSDFIQSF